MFQMQGWSSPLTLLTVELNIWMLIIHLFDTVGKVLSLEGAELGMPSSPDTRLDKGQRNENCTGTRGAGRASATFADAKSHQIVKKICDGKRVFRVHLIEHLCVYRGGN